MSPSRPPPSRRPGTPRPGSGGSSSRPRSTSPRTSSSRTTSTRTPSTRTTGAAAGAVGSGASAAPPPTTTVGEQRGRPSGRIAVVALVLLVLVISYASSLRAWLAQRDEIAAARAERVQTRERVAALEDAKQRWGDPAYVAQQVRERLGYVRPGEVGYRVLGADGLPVGSDLTLDEPVTAPGAPPPPDWYSAVWGSVQEAGTGPTG